MIQALWQFLCPETSLEKIRDRVAVMKHQLKRTLDTLPTEEERKSSIKCSLCGNEEERNRVMDEGQGMRICLGPDSRGCGGVLEERLLRQEGGNQDHSDFKDPFELFSSQAAFTSELVSSTGNTSKYQKYQRLNRVIERDLCKYNREGVFTSEVYKDTQRKEIYSLLDQVSLSITIDPVVVHTVKLLFHEYRSKMTRIHKREVAVFCLFFIALQVC